MSPDGRIAVQRSAGWHPDNPANAARYVVGVNVNGRLWAITMDTRGFTRNPHTPSTIRALAKAIATRVEEDPCYVRAIADARTDHLGVPQGNAVAGFRRQIADLIDR